MTRTYLLVRAPMTSRNEQDEPIETRSSSPRFLPVGETRYATTSRTTTRHTQSDLVDDRVSDCFDPPKRELENVNDTG